MNAKQLILGTVLGRLAMGARDVWIAFRSPADQYAMLLNDRLATELVVKLCPRGGHFIDVGAHIGSVIAAVLHLHHDRSIRVTAIEAVPAKARALQRKFPEVTVHACAVGSSGGEVSFFVNSELSGYSSLARQTGAVEIKTTMRRLDDLVDTADVVKIDVEGAELGVLQGAESLVRKHRPVIMFESSFGTGEALGYPTGSLFDWLHDRSYTVLVPNRVAHEGPGMTRESFVESHYYPRRTTNYFGIPSEHRDRVKKQARQALGIAVPVPDPPI